MNNNTMNRLQPEAAQSGSPGMLRCGDRVRIRPLDEILATLDAQGTLAGLPFMPEMVAFCGRTLTVGRRVEHVYIDHLHHVVRLADAVVLDAVRCSGAAHQGCQMGCQLIWKTAWLTGTEAPLADDRAPVSGAAIDLAADWPFPVEREGRLFCQASQLPTFAERIPWWNVRQYLTGLRAGNFSFRELFRSLVILVRNRIRWWQGKGPVGMLSGPQTRTPIESLQLQPGEWVEVKSLAEIESTLDAHGKHRGMAFVPEMALYCGKRFRVARRVERMIQEDTGKMRQLRDTVALESVTCMGIAQRQCPRRCFHLWREGWLKRVSDPACGPPSGVRVSDPQTACITAANPAINPTALTTLDLPVFQSPVSS
jgi:hypothetical protein